jgi:hypothetical protein
MTTEPNLHLPDTETDQRSSDSEPVQVLIESSTATGRMLNQAARWFMRLSDMDKLLVSVGAIAGLLTLLSILLQLISFAVKAALLVLVLFGAVKLIGRLGRSPQRENEPLD